jgi:hypothetical protein
MVRAISIDRREPESQSCPVRVNSNAYDMIVGVMFTGIVSAALFSLFFFAEGALAWLGVFGFVPLVLRMLGCQACGGFGCAPSGSAILRSGP